MTLKLYNSLKLIEFKLRKIFKIKSKDKTIDNFELIHHWDFTKIDFPTLEKSFRFTPPWGDMVNNRQIAKFIKENVKLDSNGIHFMTTKVNDDKIPYRVSGMSTKKESDLPAFGRIEAEVFISQYKGQWPAIWTVDPVKTMPEFDLFEFIWSLNSDEPKFEGNLHWGTDYKSKKYKYNALGKFPLSILDKPIKIVGEFYPNETIYYINDFPFWRKKGSFSPNNKIVLLTGGVHPNGGPTGDGVWESMRVSYLKFYKLTDELPNKNP